MINKTDEMNMYEQKCQVSQNMIDHGGSFVQALGHALALADYKNRGKFKETWPEYWEEYLHWSDD